MLDTLLTYFLLCLSAFVAGAMNSIAGGGTLLTFPALLGVVEPVIANATSTVALVPGSFAGAWGFRRELAENWPVARRLFWPSLFGGVVGSLLVTELDPAIFAFLVPWLILTAALLFLVQPLVARWTKQEHHTPPAGAAVVAVFCFQFLVAVYGGYFGAGIGILMLSSLAFMGLGDIHRMNAVKTFLASVINGTSVVVFVARGKVVWGYALPMVVAAIAGGYLGAHYSRRMRPQYVRWAVIAIGFGLSAYYFWKQFAGANS
jgi:uncharacterized membrane protein YfcA